MVSEFNDKPFNSAPILLTIPKYRYYEEKKTDSLGRFSFTHLEFPDSSKYILRGLSHKNKSHDVLTKITSKFPSETLKILLNLISAQYDVDELCKRDKEGYPIFNTFQIDALSNAIYKGTLTREMLNPNLSAKSIQDLVDKT